MDLNEFLGVAKTPPVTPALTPWDKSRRACLYVGLASFSCFATQLARIMPPLLPVIAIGGVASVISLLAWAWLTPGDQRLSITLAGLAKVSGVALGLWDAAEVLRLVGGQHWLAIGAILLIGGFVFLSEGRSHG